MAKAHFSPENFINTVNNAGLAKPNRFEVYIYFPGSLSAQLELQVQQGALSLFCDSASFPSQNIGVKQQRIYGPNYQRPVSVDYGGEGIPMTFLVDANMRIKSIFDIWISKIVDPIQYFVYEPASYVSQIKINQLDEEDNIVYSAILEDAFPRSVGMLELSNSTQNQVHKLNVTFAYRRWAPVHSISNSVTYPGVDNQKQSGDKIQSSFMGGRPGYDEAGNAISTKSLLRKTNR
jgi:hypothetical protein